jgi:hypothetical protein
MSLTDYVLERNERPRQWLWIRAWVPDRAKPYSWLRVAALALGYSILTAGVSSALIWFLFCGWFVGNGSETVLLMLPWMWKVFAILGGASGLVWGILSRLTWNPRAARLAADPASPERSATWPRRGFFFGSIPAAFYSLLIRVATPLLLFHAVENVRGTLAVRDMRAQLDKAGECYRLECVIPPPVPDEENFFATPYWKHFEYDRVTNGVGQNGGTIRWRDTNWMRFPGRLALPDAPKSETDRRIPHDGRTDLKEWAQEFRRLSTNRTPSWVRDHPNELYPIPAVPGKPAADVLAALALNESALSEFEAAAGRSKSRYPIHMDEGFSALLPALAQFKVATRSFGLRAVARLELGEVEAAAGDVRMAFRIGTAAESDSFLIGQLVRYACDAIAMHALWEGMVDHRWNEAQLKSFQAILSRLSYSDGIIRAMESERAIGNLEMERLAREGFQRILELDRLGANNPEDEWIQAPMALSVLLPKGWFQMNHVALMHGYQLILKLYRECLEGPDQLEARNRLRGDGDPVDQFIQQTRTHPDPRTFVCGMLLPALSRSMDKTLRAQAVASLGMTACALERHRLVHGKYPESLKELVPAYLDTVPLDPLNNEPMHYRATSDGWFELWSVGSNREDDDGVFLRPLKDSTGEGGELDYPWPYPKPMVGRRLF